MEQFGISHMIINDLWIDILLPDSLLDTLPIAQALVRE